MTSSPSKPSYKWWETDDKTKRLYTELLAEKLSKSSPKKGGATLTRSLSDVSFSSRYGQHNRGKASASPVRDLTRSQGIPGSPGKQLQSKANEESGSAGSSSPAKKYIFETITMDTLAKYEYIKSPKKVRSVPASPCSSLPASSSSSSLSSLCSTSSSEEEAEQKRFSSKDSPRNHPKSPGTYLANNNEARNGGAPMKIAGKWSWSLLTPTKLETEKGKSSALSGSLGKASTATPYKTSFDTESWKKPSPVFMLMTSSQKPELKTLGGSPSKGGEPRTKEGASSKEKASQLLTKLEEVPEYKSSCSSGGSTDESSSEDSTSKTKVIERLFLRDKERHDVKEKRNDPPSNDKKPPAKDGSNGEHGITDMNKKFQYLCEDVEQLEFKMYEFSDDIHKLKMAMGMKETSEANHVEYDRVGLASVDGKPRYKHSFTFTAGKDLLADRQTAHALLMRKHASPGKSPRAMAKLLLDTSIDKEVSEAEKCRNKELEEKIRRISETEMTSDEIQKVLRAAKAKYQDNPDFLEDMGISTRNAPKKG